MVNNSLLSRLKNSIILSIGIAVLLIGLVVILGWFTHQQALLTIHPSFPSVKFNTALGFVFCGVGIILNVFPSLVIWSAYLGIFLIFLSALTLAQYILGVDLHIDQFYVADFISAQSVYPGRMSPQSALAFVLIGISFGAQYFLQRKPKIKWLVGNIATSFLVVIGFSALWGYILKIPFAYTWGTHTGMAIHTALCFFLIGIVFILNSINEENLELPVILALAFGITVSFQVFNIIAHNEKTAMESKFLMDCEDRVATILMEQERNQDILRSLVAFYYSSVNVDAEEFKLFTSTVMEGHPGIKTLEWAPIIKHDERFQYEQSVSQDLKRNFEIKDIVSSELIRAADRELYFPVQFAEPMALNQKFLGLDLGAMPGRSEILQSIYQNPRMLSTDRIHLVQEFAEQSGGSGLDGKEEGQYGFITFQPVFKKTKDENAAGQLQGVVSGVFRIKDTVDGALGLMSPIAADIFVYLYSQASQPELLYHRFSDLRTEDDVKRVYLPEDLGDLKGLYYKKELQVAGRKFLYFIVPTKFYYQSARSFAPLWGSLGVISFFIILSFFIFSQFRKSVEIEDVVRQRTVQLIEANLNLQKEIKVRREAEELAVANEQKLALFIEEAPDPIVVLDKFGNIRSVNPAVERYSGFSREELVGRNFTKVGIVSSESLPRVIKEFGLVVLGHLRPAFELEIVRRDLKLLSFEVNPKRIIREGSLEVQVIFREITERKHAEQRQALQFAVARIIAEASDFDEAVPHVLDAICLALNLDYGAIWRVDQKENVLKQKESWMRPGKKFAEFAAASKEIAFASGHGLPGRVWLNNKAAWIQDVVLDQNFRRAAIAEKEGLHGALAFPIRVSGGVIGVMEFFSDKLQEPGDDLLAVLDVVGIQIGQFITRKEVEKMLKDHKFAIDQHLIIALTDVAGKILYANDLFCQISKYSRDELLGQDHRILNSGYHSKEYFKEMWHTIASGNVWHGEFRNKAKDGTCYWVDSTIVPFLDDKGKPYQYLAIRTDITPRKIVEERVKEWAQMKSDFAATVSHELRTPLTVIKGGVDVVLDEVVGPMNADQKDMLLTVKNNIDRLHRLINDVLDYQKLEAGKMQFRMKEEKFYDILKSCIGEFIPAAEKQGLQLLSEFAPGEAVVLCDRDKIVQVLVNLISNALKFTLKGAVTVRSEIKGGTITVSVADQGIGIKEEDMSKLFQSFSQIANEGERKTGGTGLGLTIVEKIITYHNGTVGARSQYGQGSTFYFSLPLVRS